MSNGNAITVARTSTDTVYVHMPRGQCYFYEQYFRFSEIIFFLWTCSMET